MRPDTRTWQSPMLLAMLVAAASLTSACDEGHSPFGPSASAVTFSGRVVEFLTQAPIPGATIRFTLQASGAGVEPSETVTDAEGRYTLRVPFGGTAYVDGRTTESLSCEPDRASAPVRDSCGRAGDPAT